MKTVIAIALLACSMTASAASWVCQGKNVIEPTKTIPFEEAFIIHDKGTSFSVVDSTGYVVFKSGYLKPDKDSSTSSGFKGGYLFTRGTGEYKGAFTVFWIPMGSDKAQGIFFNCKQIKGK